jgi:DNA-binding LacI/PurR family transcriptional regulator
VIGLVYPLGDAAPTGVETEVLCAVSAAISATGFVLALFAQPDPEAGELLHAVESGLLDGVILGQVQMQDRRVKALCDLAAPFVMMGRTANNGGLNFVDVDVDAAVEAAVEHLAALGHQRIAFLHEDADASAAAYRSLQAYERACARRRIRLVTPTCHPSAAHARSATSTLLGQHEITALVVWGDKAGLGAYQAARAADRRIPDSLSLVCLGGTQLSELLGLTMTCVGLRLGEKAQQAAEMLLNILSGAKQGDRQVLLEPQWSGGETTAAPDR